MKTLKRDSCAILHLVLKGKWYDMIASGEKKEEYRESKPYWKTRIENWRAKQSPSWADIDKNPWLVIGFSCGYRKPDMFFLSRMTDLREHSFHPEWGEPEKEHYILALGERVQFEFEVERPKC